MVLIFNFVLLLLGVLAYTSISYLLVLLVVAAKREKWVSNEPRDTPFTIIIPAHNEEIVIATTLESLLKQEYPRELFSIVVVADNCSDRTSEIAHGLGVFVLERANLVERGKGYALAFATNHLLESSDPAGAFVIVDADTWVAPDFLNKMSARLKAQTDSRGYCALQGRYGVLNASEGWRAALMSGAFDLFNHVKPMGRERLKLGVGLKGNGMVFTRSLMAAAPWKGDSVTEDIDYALDLVRHYDVRVGYVPEALVRAQMPTTSEQATSQRERWEGGRYALLRTKAIPLIAEAIRRRNAVLFDAAIDLFLPPLAELAFLIVGWAVLIEVGSYINIVHWATPWLWACTGAFVALLMYILGGFAVSGASKEAYVALLCAPFYAIWKICLYAAKPFRKRKAQASGQSEWVRTERTPISGQSPVSEPKATNELD